MPISQAVIHFVELAIRGRDGRLTAETYFSPELTASQIAPSTRGRAARKAFSTSSSVFLWSSGMTGHVILTHRSRKSGASAKSGTPLKRQGREPPKTISSASVCSFRVRKPDPVAILQKASESQG